jgi:hypothetical protein
MRFSVLAALGLIAFLGIMTIDAPDANAIARGTAVVSGPRGTAVVSRSTWHANRNHHASRARHNGRD